MTPANSFRRPAGPTGANALAVLLILLLTACAAQKPAKLAVTPPAPQPAPPPPAPLIYPQNTFTPPPAQPIPAGAVPPQPPGGLAIASPPDSTPAAPRPAPIRTPGPARAETQPAAVPENPAEPPAVARQPSELQSRVDRALNRNTVAARLRTSRALIAQLDRLNLSGQAKDDRNRAASLVDLAAQALNRGDLRQADDFAGRAAILARTLLDAK